MRNHYFLIMFFVLSSCGRTEKPKIAFLSFGNTIPYFNKGIECFENKAKELNNEVLIYYANHDAKMQYNQAAEAIQKGAKAIVIVPVNTNAGAAIVRLAHESGVPVIAYDGIIRNCDLDYYISFDSHEVGQSMANAALKMKPKGTYVLLWGDGSDDNAYIMKNGALNVLETSLNNGSIKIIYQAFIEEWAFDNAEHEMREFKKLYPHKIDAFICANDALAQATISVLKAYNQLDSIFISGQDSEVASLKSILRGEQTLTFKKSPVTIGNTAAELASEVVNNKTENINKLVNKRLSNKFKEVPSVILQPQLINKYNLESVAFSDGFIKKEEVY